MDLNPNYCECGNKKSYSSEYDCFYCKNCNLWLEGKCDDEECEYCRARPPQPSDYEPIQDVGAESLDR
jgi:hypothetical protein